MTTYSGTVFSDDGRPLYITCIFNEMNTHPAHLSASTLPPRGFRLKGKALVARQNYVKRRDHISNLLTGSTYEELRSKKLRKSTEESKNKLRRNDPASVRIREIRSALSPEKSLISRIFKRKFKNKL